MSSTSDSDTSYATPLSDDEDTLPEQVKLEHSTLNPEAMWSDKEIVPRRVERSIRSDDLRAVLPSYKRVRALSIKGARSPSCALSAPAVRALADALRARPGLRKLALRVDFTRSAQSTGSLEALTEAMLSAGTRLESLCLDMCCLGLCRLDPLASLLQTAVCSELQELDLSFNELGRAVSLAGLKLPPQLRVFRCVRNGLGDVHAGALAAILQTSNTLEQVSLCGNSLSGRGLEKLLTALEGSPIRELYVTYNKLGLDGARALVRALPRFKSLLALCLDECELLNEGARILAEGVRDNPNIMSDGVFIYMRGNNIDHDVRLELVAMLEDRVHFKFDIGEYIGSNTSDSDTSAVGRSDLTPGAAGDGTPTGLGATREPGAKIEPGATGEHGATGESGAKIENGAKIEHGATKAPFFTIGSSNHPSNNTVASTAPQPVLNTTPLSFDSQPGQSFNPGPFSGSGDPKLSTFNTNMASTESPTVKPITTPFKFSIGTNFAPSTALKSDITGTLSQPAAMSFSFDSNSNLFLAKPTEPKTSSAPQPGINTSNGTQFSNLPKSTTKLSFGIDNSGLSSTKSVGNIFDISTSSGVTTQPSATPMTTATTGTSFGTSMFGAKPTFSQNSAATASSTTNVTTVTTGQSFGPSVLGAKPTFSQPRTITTSSTQNVITATTGQSFGPNIFGTKPMFSSPSATATLSSQNVTTAATGRSFGMKLYGATPIFRTPSATTISSTPNLTTATTGQPFGTSVFGAKLTLSQPSATNTTSTPNVTTATPGQPFGTSVFGAKPMFSSPSATATSSTGNVTTLSTGQSFGTSAFGAKPMFSPPSATSSFTPTVTTATTGQSFGTNIFGAIPKFSPPSATTTTSKPNVTTATTEQSFGMSMFGAKPTFSQPSATTISSTPNVTTATTGQSFGTSVFGAKPMFSPPSATSSFTPNVTTATTGPSFGTNLFGAKPVFSPPSVTTTTSKPNVTTATTEQSFGMSMFGAKPTFSQPSATTISSTPNVTTATTGQSFGTSVFGAKPMFSPPSATSSFTPNVTTATTGQSFGTNLFGAIPKFSPPSATTTTSKPNVTTATTEQSFGMSMFGAKPTFSQPSATTISSTPNVTTATTGQSFGTSVFGAKPMFSPPSATSSFTPNVTAATTGQSFGTNIFGAKPMFSSPSATTTSSAQNVTTATTEQSSGTSMFGAKLTTEQSATTKTNQPFGTNIFADKSTAGSIFSSTIPSFNFNTTTTATPKLETVNPTASIYLSTKLYGTLPGTDEPAKISPTFGIFGTDKTGISTTANGPFGESTTDTTPNISKPEAGQLKFAVGTGEKPAKTRRVVKVRRQVQESLRTQYAQVEPLAQMLDAKLSIEGPRFLPVVCTEDGKSVRYQNVVCLQGSQRLSPEEMRLEHEASLRGPTVGELSARLSSEHGLRRLVLSGRPAREGPVLVVRWPPPPPTLQELEGLRKSVADARASLEVLELSHVPLGDLELEVLGTLLASPLCSQLQELRLVCVSPGAAAGWRLADALRGASAPPPRLVLRGSALGSDLMAAIAQGLERAGSRLRVLDARGVRADRALAGLARLLEGTACRDLQELYLCDNWLGRAGARELCGALRPAPTLRVLRLDGNCLRDEHAAELAPVLQSARRLEELSVRGNRLGAAGAMALVLALSGCTGLRRLALAGAALGPAGAATLAAALPRLNQLREIDLRDCSLGPEGYETLFRAFILNSEFVSPGALQAELLGERRAELVFVEPRGRGGLRADDFLTTAVDGKQVLFAYRRRV